MAFTFQCHTCGETHEGMPGFGADAPLSYYEVPEAERAVRCTLGTDHCIIDGELFFVRGCIEIPVEDEADPFIWGVWVSLSEASFRELAAADDAEHRSHLGPYFGWLNAWLKPYPETMNLKTMLHPRDGGVRPFIELEPTDHPLAVEQREGIDRNRVAELYSLVVHD